MLTLWIEGVESRSTLGALSTHTHIRRRTYIFHTYKQHCCWLPEGNCRNDMSFLAISVVCKCRLAYLFLQALFQQGIVTVRNTRVYVVVFGSRGKLPFLPNGLFSVISSFASTSTDKPCFYTYVQFSGCLLGCFTRVSTTINVLFRFLFWLPEMLFNKEWLSCSWSLAGQGSRHYGETEAL